MKCIKCRKELPESEFYQSDIKNHTHICKECKKTVNKKWLENKVIKDECANNFNLFYGGYEIRILNFARENEYKFIIKGTDGYFTKTNDKEEFIKKLLDILK
jgi:hypothetical protein